MARDIAAYPRRIIRNREVIVDHAGGAGADGAWGAQFSAFPLGTVTLSSSLGILRVVRNSIDRFFTAWPGGKQGNSFVHIFAAAARVAWRPKQLFDTWEAYLSNQSDPVCRMYPNGMVEGCGGTGLENVGGTAYVNEMLLQSHEGFIRVFPSCALADVSFRLRAIGGFEVFANRTDGAAGAIVIRSLGGSSICSVLSPWPAMLVNGAPQELVNGKATFAVERGGRYTLLPDRSEVFE